MKPHTDKIIVSNSMLTRWDEPRPSPILCMSDDIKVWAQMSKFDETANSAPHDHETVPDTQPNKKHIVPGVSAVS